MYAHEQCLLCYGHCADIWYEGALYLQRASENGVSRINFVLLINEIRVCACVCQDKQCRTRWAEEASVMFDRAISGPLKNNLLIHLAYANFEEVRIHLPTTSYTCYKLVKVLVKYVEVTDI